MHEQVAQIYRTMLLDIDVVTICLDEAVRPGVWPHLKTERISAKEHCQHILKLMTDE